MALISECENYRYWLERSWEQEGSKEEELLFVLLNPSTADDKTDDPTIRKLRGFTSRWGYRKFKVVNLYALRSSKPDVLKADHSPVGAENDYWLKRLLGEHRTIVCAWGNHADKRRVQYFRGLADELGVSLLCLGKTKQGQPRHPLYLPYDQKLETYV
ncbi:DUF1643 domain-containing protein [Salimicrobium halophilum]|uniref:DUF1643 domain-containing protein n=1 Tax=Salimicrobium halophilum TaxID=86666 RepID=A0A1G8SB70_9BACI|nr:DUF1643 domain-containing protein [Salimicrobium halophilum]SDJ26441.1 hypothetical protein SAMN04490247_1357 [Salimicrobium halophilum]